MDCVRIRLSVRCLRSSRAASSSSRANSSSSSSVNVIPNRSTMLLLRSFVSNRCSRRCVNSRLASRQIQQLRMHLPHGICSGLPRSTRETIPPIVLPVDCLYQIQPTQLTASNSIKSFQLRTQELDVNARTSDSIQTAALNRTVGFIHLW